MGNFSPLQIGLIGIICLFILTFFVGIIIGIFQATNSIWMSLFFLLFIILRILLYYYVALLGIKADFPDKKIYENATIMAGLETIIFIILSIQDIGNPSFATSIASKVAGTIIGATIFTFVSIKINRKKDTTKIKKQGILEAYD